MAWSFLFTVSSEMPEIGVDLNYVYLKVPFGVRKTGVGVIKFYEL